MHNWLQKLSELQQQGIPAVMVTVASIVGSTPREVGSKMIVSADDLFGTIGGGNLEFQAIKIARDQLDNPVPQQLRRFPLGAGLGQCCGGLVNLLFEPVIGVNEWIGAVLEYEGLDREWVREVSITEVEADILIRPSTEKDQTCLLDNNRFVEVSRSQNIELVLFGAGHVGRAIVNTLRDLPVQIRWVDSRENEFPSDVSSSAEIICTDTPEAEIDAANSGAYFLVMTHDHSLDQRLAEQILKRNDFAYFGLIGSTSKRRMFETRMARRGIEVEKFKNMICPIGIDGIRNKQPAMIAISVVAQIMQRYDQHQNNHIHKQQKQTRLAVTVGRSK